MSLGELSERLRGCTLHLRHSGVGWVASVVEGFVVTAGEPFPDMQLALFDAIAHFEMKGLADELVALQARSAT